MGPCCHVKQQLNSVPFGAVSLGSTSVFQPLSLFAVCRLFTLTINATFFMDLAFQRVLSGAEHRLCEVRQLPARTMSYNEEQKQVLGGVVPLSLHCGLSELAIVVPLTCFYTYRASKAAEDTARTEQCLKF